ncbi:MAG: LLM class flavin-dependent oxidoreductase [Pseudohongiellaceae bacterium]|nr:LLM class flavin-dependent oxidoreductase [Pseudohongiellaceae bacterium]
MRLSVLDQSPIRSGGTAYTALQESIELAQHAERLGYSRYWVAEHHGSKSFAGCSPEVLLAQIGAKTSTIRIGSGGVMLCHYSPYKVAENFLLLQTLFPDRVDLGVGRAPGSDGLTAQALAYGSPIGVEYFRNKLMDLEAFLHGTRPETDSFSRVKATPAASPAPQTWLLGSSEQSAIYAGELGMRYSIANFLNPAHSHELASLYRSRFVPSEALPEPEVNVGVFVLCAPTQEQADDLALTRDVWRLGLERGNPGPIPSVQEARDYPLSASEAELLRARRRYALCGTPEAMVDRLQQVAEQHQADELVVISNCHDFVVRKQSYSLLAKAFGLAS